MPELLPKCATYVEDGANFIHGNNIKNLLEVSTDGYVKCQKHESSGVCSSMLNYDHYDMIVECKCPFPNEYNVPVHYSLPNRYVTQILAGMCTKRVVCCLYVSHSKCSTMFLKCTFNSDLWHELWDTTKDLCDKIDISKPNNLHDNVPN